MNSMGIYFAFINIECIIENTIEKIKCVVLFGMNFYFLQHAWKCTESRNPQQYNCTYTLSTSDKKEASNL